MLKLLEKSFNQINEKFYDAVSPLIIVVILGSLILRVEDSMLFVFSYFVLFLIGWTFMTLNMKKTIYNDNDEYSLYDYLIRGGKILAVIYLPVTFIYISLPQLFPYIAPFGKVFSYLILFLIAQYIFLMFINIASISIDNKIIFNPNKFLKFKNSIAFLFLIVLFYFIGTILSMINEFLYHVSLNLFLYPILPIFINILGGIIYAIYASFFTLFILNIYIRQRETNEC